MITGTLVEEAALAPMTDDRTLADGALGQPEVSVKISIEEVDDILGAVIDGRYEVLTRLGQGGMGFVYEARDLALGGLPVVLKTLRPELVFNEKSAERFSREAMAQAGIDHPHVIKVTGYGVNAEYGAYYVMERLVGADLGEILAANPAPMPIDRVLDIATQVASALGAAHELSIVHRDLKPENVFLTDVNGREFAKVLDFGLARLLDSQNKLTETGAVIGTPRYMSPEQCMGEKVDARADVYALALVMYEMLSGQQPYVGLGTYEILGKKMLDELPPPSQLDPPVYLDPRVESFIMRCLARVPDARPKDGRRLGALIAGLREDLKSPISRVPALPVPTVRASVPTPVARQVGATTVLPPRKSGLGARFTMLALILAVLGIASGGLAFWLLRTPQTSEETPAETTAVVEPPTLPEPVDPVQPPPTEPVSSLVHVVTEPAGALVRHGEREFGLTPLELRVPQDIGDGETLELSLEGYVTRTINVSAEVTTTHARLHRSSDRSP